MTYKKNVPLWFLAILTLSGTLAMHIFVPVLPLVGQYFHADLHQVQLTLSIYILGLALGQLIYGPVADTIGRRPVLIFGMILYTLAGLSAIFATNLYMLIIMRFLQALGGCTGLLLGRTIVRDTSTGIETTKRLSLMNMMVMFGPGLAPILGGFLAFFSGWKSIFVLLSILGLVNLILVCIFVQDTPQKNSNKSSIRKVFIDYRKLVISPKFLGYTLGGSLATTAFYGFLGVSSYIVLHQLHGTIHDVGVYLALIMVGIWLGTFTSTRLVSRITLNKMIFLGSSFSLFFACLLFIFTFVDYLTPYSIMVPVIGFCFGVGLTSTAALTNALNVNPQIAGSASGLYGFTQMAVGAICTSLSAIGNNPAFSAALILLIASIISTICFLISKYTEA